VVQLNTSKFPRATKGYEKLREKFPLPALMYDNSASGPTLSDAGFDLLKRLLHHDPSQRISAAEACNHAWYVLGLLAACLTPTNLFGRIKIIEEILKKLKKK
jgi:serine/threonine protein kinase